MFSTLLATAGLVLDIAGVLMLARYGLPIAPMDEQGNLFNSDLATMGFAHPEAVAMARQFRSRARLALWIIVFGFGFQLIAVWVR